MKARRQRLSSGGYCVWKENHWISLDCFLNTVYGIGLKGLMHNVLLLKLVNASGFVQPLSSFMLSIEKVETIMQSPIKMPHFSSLIEIGTGKFPMLCVLRELSVCKKASSRIPDTEILPSDDYFCSWDSSANSSHVGIISVPCLHTNLAQYLITTASDTEDSCLLGNCISALEILSPNATCARFACSYSGMVIGVKDVLFITVYHYRWTAV